MPKPNKLFVVTGEFISLKDDSEVSWTRQIETADIGKVLKIVSEMTLERNLKLIHLSAYDTVEKIKHEIPATVLGLPDKMGVVSAPLSKEDDPPRLAASLADLAGPLPALPAPEPLVLSGFDTEVYTYKVTEPSEDGKLDLTA